jgi:hypothetical protein
MVTFIHITDKNSEKPILRSGIKLVKRRSGIRGVYAMPVIPDFTTTHQWSRELKRQPIRTLICVQFKVPDEEPVLVGKYNGEKLQMTAAEALGTILEHTDPMGLEVIFPRKIAPGEITRAYLAPRVTGWRYYPTAKGRKPCHCKWCNSGEIRAQRLIREDV